MSPRELSVEERGKVYDILVECCGAPLAAFVIKVANERIRAALAVREERGHLDLLRRIVKEAEFSAEAASTPDGWADTALGRVLGEAEALLLGEVEELPGDGQRPTLPVETWMVDYEHGDGEPQHAVLSWLDDEAKDLPEVGTQLVRKSDYDALLTGPASYSGVKRSEAAS